MWNILYVVVFLLCVINYCYSQKDTVINLGEAKYSVIKANIHWVSKVVNFSSQYSDKVKSANQILGKPNVLPSGGTSSCAWTPKKGIISNFKKASIRVAFREPMKVKQVAVAENFNPGAIEKIILYGTKNEELVVYQNNPSPVNIGHRMLNVFIEPTPFDVIEGEIQLYQRKVPDFEIDAFGISDTWDTVKAEVNVAPDIKYSYRKERLGEGINTQYDETAPVISPDGKTLFFDRKFSAENTGGIKDEDDIWFSWADEKGNWSKAVNIGPPLNTKWNNFVQSITPDGNTLLLGNIYGKKGVMYPGISISHRGKVGWTEPIAQDIQYFVNYNDHVSYCLSNSNKYLLIASETDNNYGGLDLYVSFRTSDNSWSEPKNLGTVINTAVNDNSPFLAADDITLYYSTSGISGYGKEDIFMTRRLDDTWQNWTEPLNLGTDINTKEADSKYTIPASGEYAYFSSIADSSGMRDIYRIKLPEAVKPKPVVLVKGKVLNNNNNRPVSAEFIFNDSINNKEIGRTNTNLKTGEFVMILPANCKYSFKVIAGGFTELTMDLNLADIKEYKVIELSDIKLIPPKKNIKGTIRDALTEKNISGASVFLIVDTVTGDTLAKSTTNEQGEFSFDIPENLSDNDRELLLVVERDGYEKKEIKIFESDDTDALLLNFDMKAIMKEEKVLEFHNIYFEYKSAELTAHAKSILDRLVDVMKENGGMGIELSAHTDSRAGAESNLALSQKRADNAKIYMVSKGISDARITAKGYGETMLLNRCKDGVECSEEEHAVNRRIEVKVLKLQ